MPRHFRTSSLVAGTALAAMALLAGDARVLPAQESPCTIQPAIYQSSDACQKARDLFAFLAPQLGVALAGGNHLPGEGGTLGFGRLSGALRLIAVRGRAPDNEVPISITGSAQSSDFGAREIPLAVPSLDAAVGLWSGIPMGLTNIGGIDLLGGITYIPSIGRQPWRLEPEGSGIGFSYGVRVGLLQESSVIPGLAISYMRRQLPSLDAAYTPDDDTLRVADTKVTAHTLRATVSKRFWLIGFVAGVGSDRLVTTSSLDAIVNDFVLGVPQRTTISLPLLEQTVTRKTAFVNAALGPPRIRLVGEFGWSSAGSIRETVNSFGDRRANEGYQYGSLGLGFRF